MRIFVLVGLTDVEALGEEDTVSDRAAVYVGLVGKFG
jgi:hypothetical protein